MSNLNKNIIISKKNYNNDNNLNIDDNIIENSNPILDNINEKKDINLYINNNNKIIENDNNNSEKNINFNNNENESIINVSQTNEKNCILCESEVSSAELESNQLPCSHLFCSECYFQYLKEKINSNLNITSIVCMQYKCPTILTKEFILNQIKKDESLSKKYERFLNKAIMHQNSNKKNCPEPNCESYLEYKNDNNYYLTCENGHKYCFKCLRKWHGKKKCSKLIERDFKKWKKGKIVKQCPKCGMWTEKIDGCNHMTCLECKFQWCWLCKGAYSDMHFVVGSCAGLQFNEKKFFQYKICILLYNFVMFFIIRIGLWISTPYIITYYCIINTFEDDLYGIINYDSKKYCMYLMCFSNIFFTAVYYPFVFMIIGIFVILPITIIPPLMECLIRCWENKDKYYIDSNHYNYVDNSYLNDDLI